MNYELIDKIRLEKEKEGKRTSLTRRALNKLTEEEIRETIESIGDGWWHDPEPIEVYVTNEEILEYAKNDFGIE